MSITEILLTIATASCAAGWTFARLEIKELNRQANQMRAEIAHFIRSARSANDLASKSQFVKMFP